VVLIKIAKAGTRYIGHVVRLEVLTQEFPLLLDDIKPYIDQHDMDVYVAKIQDKNVGHALVTFDAQRREAIIDSIGTHPDFRNNGVSRTLLKQISRDADHHMDVYMYVPSYTMEDTDDTMWHIEPWTWKVGFKCIGERLDEYFRYGRTWDAYVLRLMHDTQTCCAPN
jgi:N-acetylglutamate synthase-like GNAT family acetyltransferase